MSPDKMSPDKMSLDKMSQDEMSHRQNVTRTICHTDKMSQEKCLAGVEGMRLHTTKAISQLVEAPPLILSPDRDRSLDVIWSSQCFNGHTFL